MLEDAAPLSADLSAQHRDRSDFPDSPLLRRMVGVVSRSSTSL